MKILFKIALVCLGFAVISPAKAADFDIVINYVPGSNFTPSQKAAFAQAEATWESLITSYKPNSVTAGTTLVIDADNPPIDGVNGILGSAGPTSGILAGSYLFATAGSMSFDSADVAALESNGTWAAVILHEMGHVIGIGTLWSSAGVGVPGFQELYVDGTGQYTGATGLAAYQQEFVGQQSATFVPVELGGGGGTANGHWNEGDGGGTTGITRVSDGKDMNLMLMSGWLNGGSFISDTTLGSFEDLGYNTTLDLNPQDTTPPTADLSSPADGDSIAPSVLNAQGYIEVTFSDVGDGVDAASIDGGELSLSGSGVGTATLSGGAPTLVSGTTYRYAFTGSFAVGSVDVEFVAGSFADLAETPNTNATETEGFTVSEIGEISGTVWEDNNSDGVIDTGEALLENWTVFLDDNQNGQLDGGELSVITNANGAYTFSGLAAGSYTVAMVTQEGYTQISPVQALLDPAATADPLSFNIDKHSQVSLADFNAVAATSSSKVNDIVAYVSPGGQEYAIIGLEKAVGFVRVTDPVNPVIVAALLGPDEGGAPSLVAANSTGEEHNDEEHPAKEGSNWRDLAVYGTHAYVVNENSGGIQVFDLSLIDSGTVSILSTAGQFGPAKSHNVTINPDSGYLYLSGSSAGGLQVYELNTDPSTPTFVGSSPVSYIHDLIVHSYTSGPYAGKEIVFAFSGGSGVRIIDVTDKNNMVVMSTTSYPNKTYTHHGALSEDLQYLFVNDELDEPNNANVSTTTTYILDIQNLSAPSYITSFTNGLAAIDHNPMVRGNYLYEANYTSGLRVYDISDINNVTEVGHYDTYPATNATTFHGAWGVDASLPSGNVIVSDIQGGLFVLDPSRVQATNGSYLVELGDLETVTGVDFGVEGPLSGNVQIIDDGDAGFASGGFSVNAAPPTPGYETDVSYSQSGGGNTASWTFNALTAGDYRVSTTWTGHPNRATNAAYTVFDGAAQVSVVTVNQQLSPANDVTVGSVNFRDLGVFTISGDTLVVQLSDSGNGYVIADAIRIELVTPTGPDATAPTADLSSPADGDSIDPAAINAQGYLAVTFADSGDGIDAATIDGDELSLSGSGVGTAALSGGTPTLVSGSTYRYGFTGEFIEGGVNVTFLAGSFADLAGTPNLNVLETESFTVSASPPAPTIQIIDDGDAGFASGGFSVNAAPPTPGYETDVSYSQSGGGNTASWTFNALTAGDYRVSTTWTGHPNRATNAAYTVFDGAAQVSVVTVNQRLSPANDVTVGSVNFRDLGVFTISGDTLVVQLSDSGNGYVIADAIRIELVTPTGPDATAPTADLSSPADGDSIDPAAINAQGYLAVTFADSGDGIDAATIDGDELSLSGSGVGTAALSGGTPTLVSGSTYRYGFTGEFIEGGVNVTFLAGSFADLAGTPNLNVLETESFTVSASPPAPTIQIIDDGDAGFASGGFSVNAAPPTPGYETDVSYSQSGGGNTASWTFNALTAGDYRVSTTWTGHPNRATNAAYTVFDGAAQVSVVTVNQQLSPANDVTVGSVNFRDLGVFTISGDTLVVQLSDSGNGYVIADAIRIELVTPTGPDATAPTADLSSPADGDSIDPAAINAQGYLAVTFADSGDGIDAATIDGDELSLSGSGVGTAALSGGTPTLVSGSTYRYGFTGEFIEGGVNVTFLAGSFADLAGTPNLNVLETESFTVSASPPAPTIQIIDDGDAGFASGGFSVNAAPPTPGYETDVSYSQSGGGNTASWTFNALTAGDYRVSTTWTGHPNRATNAAYTVFDGAAQVSVVTVNQRLSPANDVTVGSVNFRDLGVFTISGDTLVVQLSDSGNGYVIADAIRIELVTPTGPDATAPTADLSSPADGDSIDPAAINAQGYLAVTFADSGDGIDAATIDGDELSLSGSGVGTAALSGGTPTLVSGSTYRYGFTGEFIEGGVNVTFLAGSFADLAGTPNLNVLETESFTVSASPPAPTIQIIDDGDAGFASGGFSVNAAPPTPGYETDVSYSQSGGGNTASWTFNALTAGDYRVSTTWTGHPNRATNAAYTVFDGAAQVSVVTVNQQLSPANDVTVGSVNFRDLGVFTISGDTLVVQLSDSGNGYVIADAIRIELITPSLTSSESSSESSLTGSSAITSNDSYQLASGGLVSGGLDDTSTTDSDGDGVADDKDLFPNDADFARVSDYVNFIIDYLLDDRVIFDEDWKELQNEAEFTAGLEAVLELVLAAEQAQDPEWAALLYMEALGIVDDELLIRTDGFHGGSFEDDWMIVEEAQDILHADLDSLREYLWLIAP